MQNIRLFSRQTKSISASLKMLLQNKVFAFVYRLLPWTPGWSGRGWMKGLAGSECEERTILLTQHTSAGQVMLTGRNAAFALVSGNFCLILRFIKAFTSQPVTAGCCVLCIPGPWSSFSLRHISIDEEKCSFYEQRAPHLSLIMSLL